MSDPFNVDNVQSTHSENFQDWPRDFDFRIQYAEQQEVIEFQSHKFPVTNQAEIACDE